MRRLIFFPAQPRCPGPFRYSNSELHLRQRPNKLHVQLIPDRREEPDMAAPDLIPVVA
jgi:hypothetical protein